MLAFWAAGADGKEREDWDLLVAVIASADLPPVPLSPPYTNNNQHTNHQQFPYLIHFTTTPQPESFTLVVYIHTHTHTHSRRHSQHCILHPPHTSLLHPSCLRPSPTALHQPSSPHKPAYSGDPVTFARIATAANLSWENSRNTPFSPSAPLLACDRCFNACTPLGNRRLLTGFTIRPLHNTPTPWALHPICPRVFPAGSGRRTHGAARRNATWALSRATSSRHSMLATASGGWEDCDAIRER